MYLLLDDDETLLYSAQAIAKVLETFPGLKKRELFAPKESVGILVTPASPRRRRLRAGQWDPSPTHMPYHVRVYEQRYTVYVLMSNAIVCTNTTNWSICHDVLMYKTGNVHTRMYIS